MSVRGCYDSCYSFGLMRMRSKLTAQVLLGLGSLCATVKTDSSGVCFPQGAAIYYVGQDVATSKITLTSGGTPPSTIRIFIYIYEKATCARRRWCDPHCSCSILSWLEDEFSSGEPEARQIPGAVGLRSLRRRCCRRRCPLYFHELAIEASGDHLGARLRWRQHCRLPSEP